MTQEEKAKAYDEAFKEAEKIHKFSSDIAEIKRMEQIFPELAESEDERIRKEIISHLQHEYVVNRHVSGVEYDRWIAWLEKQGKTSPILSNSSNIGKNDDKVEPKFKVGDWIYHEISGNTFHINKIENDLYVSDEGATISLGRQNDWRTWTIQDAKDCDVLCCESGWTCIFKTLNSDNISFSSYCFMDNTGWFCETGSESHTLEKAFIKAYNGNIYPATKEQRDLLFAKMKEAGYMWDSESKQLLSLKAEPSGKQKPAELAKGEDYGIDGLWHAQRILEKTFGKVDGYQTDDGILSHECAISAVKELYEKKPSWSEEDEKNLQGILDVIEANKSSAPDYDLETYDRFLSWLESLKQRIGV